MTEKKIIVWFRQDLRLSDHPALFKAAQEGRVLPLFILEDDDAGDMRRGAASRVWLHYALSALDDALDNRLVLEKGRAEDVLDRLISEQEIDAVFWNRCYEPWRIARDSRIKKSLSGRGVRVESFNGSLLWEPWDVLKADQTPYRVFTPFYRKGCLANGPVPRAPLPLPERLDVIPDASGQSLDSLDLVPERDWGDTMMAGWDASEAGAEQALDRFLNQGLAGYKTGRDYPSEPHVSRLSPYLHFGQISPHRIWAALEAIADSPDRDHFRSELAWREFSYSLLYHFPHIATEPLQQGFAAFPWREDDEALQRWQKGLTGIPIVDAGMRELWQTGYMHNRVRMIVASFLVKNLLVPWTAGEVWFRDTLVDADYANNPASWQWVAGSGADAAPYFRIFNPVTQGKKFDPEGCYVRTYVPELSDVPDKYIHCPSEMPAELAAHVGFKPGATYPLPLVNLKASRERALAAFKEMKAQA